MTEPAPAAEAIRPLLERFPPEFYDRGEILIEDTLLQTTDFAPMIEPGTAPAEPGAATADTGADTGDTGPPAMVGYVIEGLVRGVWNRTTLSPGNRATAVVAGDGRWIGADAFKFGKNFFRYSAMTPTTAVVLPVAYMEAEASREILLDALRCVSQNWCTTASVMSLGANTLGRRTLLLLFDISRLHPRPELEVRQKDIADMLGVTRQTLQPVLKELERRELISLGYGEIVIGDPIGLVRRLRRSPKPR